MQRKLCEGNLTILPTPLYSDFYLGALCENHILVREANALLKEVKLCPRSNFRWWCHHMDIFCIICVVFILVCVFSFLRRISSVLRVKGCRSTAVLLKWVKLFMIWTRSGILFGFLWILCFFPPTLYYKSHI